MMLKANEESFRREELLRAGIWFLCLLVKAASGNCGNDMCGKHADELTAQFEKRFALRDLINAK